MQAKETLIGHILTIVYGYQLPGLKWVPINISLSPRRDLCVVIFFFVLLLLLWHGHLAEQGEVIRIVKQGNWTWHGVIESLFVALLENDVGRISNLGFLVPVQFLGGGFK